MLHQDITDPIIGAFHSVYREHGFGFLERVYSNSLAIELGVRGLLVRREVTSEIVYRGVTVGFYRVDMVVEEGRTPCSVVRRVLRMLRDSPFISV